MILKPFVITLFLSLASPHPQYKPSEGTEFGAHLENQCGHPSYDCVPYYQCHNGVIDTDGVGRIDLRLKPQGNCINPDYPDSPSFCCLIPGQPATSKPLEICPADNVCVNNIECSAGAFFVHDTCFKPDGSLGVCCAELSPSRIEEHCPKDQVCVPWEKCVDGITFDGVSKSDHIKPSNYDALKCDFDGYMCCASSSFPPYPVHDGNKPADSLSLQCGHPSYDCVPYFQCNNGVIDAEGTGLIDVRIRPTGTCSNPEYPDVPALCCLIPGEPATPKPLDICPGSRECVKSSQCSADGFIVTDGAGNINLRSEYSIQICHTFDEKLGVCCTPPPAIVDHCHGSSKCVDHIACTGKSLDINNNFVTYSLAGKWSECALNQYGKKGICCILQSPNDVLPPLPPLPELLEHCPLDSYCTDRYQCLGLALDSSKSFVEHNFEGDWAHCAFEPNGLGTSKGVCCKQPPSELSSCPSNSRCVPQKSCHGEALNDVGTFVTYDALLPSWSLCRVEEFDIGLCCLSQDHSLEPATKCGTRNYHIDQRIQANYAENEAAFGEFPWQSIIFFQNYTFKCGGTLISNSHVLTAAHCVQNLLPSDMRIRLGEWQVNSFDEPLPYEDHNVYKLYIHPEFNPKNVHNDIAILEMEHPVKLQYHINAVCLPSHDHKFINRESCFTTGWGKDSFKGAYQHILKKIDLPYVDPGTCEALLRKTRLGKYFKLNKSFNCAGGEENKDACFGDGGGPLVCKDHGSGEYLLAGITSWGIDCGLKDVPGVYVNVQLFKSWIDDIVLGFSKEKELIGEVGVIGYGK